MRPRLQRPLLWSIAIVLLVILSLIFSQRTWSSSAKPSASSYSLSTEQGNDHSTTSMFSSYWQEETESCLGYMTFDKYGGLGNRMSHYATLLAYTRMLGMRPVISSDSHSIISEFFPSITIPVAESTMCKVPEDFTQILPCNVIRKGLNNTQSLNVMIKGWPHDVAMFDKYRDIIREEFVFKHEYERAADHFLHMVSKQARITLEMREGLKQLLFIGVHVRRTDYEQWMRSRKEGILVTHHFFTRAMDTMKERFGHLHNVVFIVASDDLEWCKNKFQDRPDVFFSDGNERLRFLKAKGFDLALLSKCNHSIIDYGTFGFWAAYLSGGEVIMAKDFALKPMGLLKDVKEAELSNWQFMADPCIEILKNNQTLKREVVNNCSGQDEEGAQ